MPNVKDAVLTQALVEAAKQEAMAASRAFSRIGLDWNDPRDAIDDGLRALNRLMEKIVAYDASPNLKPEARICEKCGTLWPAKDRVPHE